MELEKTKNKYGYERVECPFCHIERFISRTTKANPDPLRNLKQHITNEAKKEALARCLAGEPIMNDQHLAYYIQHTSPIKKVVLEDKRIYDDDLTLKK